MLIPSYRPLISRTKPVIKTIKVWSEEATSRLQDCFDLTEWDVFKEGADLDEYTTSVLTYIDFCTETVLTTKIVRNFPYQKPWFDKIVWFLLKERNAAFKSGDAQAYSNARRDLKKGIKEAKYRCKQRLEAQFDNNSCSLWKAIKVITDYNGRSSHISNNTCLPDSLNCFFARFDDQNDNGAYSEIKQDGRAIVLKYHQVRSSQASEKLELNIIQPLLRKAQTCRTALFLSPLLYSLYTHDCVATHSSNVIVKFADDTTVAGLTTDYEESAYREEVHTLTNWCHNQCWGKLLLLLLYFLVI